MIIECLTSLLAENFSVTAGVWSYLVSQEVIDFINPDIVVLEIAERGLNEVLLHLGESYCKPELDIDKEKNILDVAYYDNGELDNLYVAIWSIENGQDDLVWYEATRLDSNKWQATIDLTQHTTRGKISLHFYSGLEGDGELLTTIDYDIDSLHN